MGFECEEVVVAVELDLSGCCRRGWWCAGVADADAKVELDIKVGDRAGAGTGGGGGGAEGAWW